VSKAIAYSSRAPSKWHIWLLTLTPNTRQRCNGTPLTNTLAYLQKIVNDGKKKFYKSDAKIQIRH